MCPSIVGDIAIQVGADIGPLVTNLGKGQAAVSRFGATADASAKGGMRSWSLAGTAMGAAAAVAGLGLVALTKRAIDNAGALNDASKSVGVHVASLQAMSQVASEAGSSQEELLSSLKRMQNNIASLLTGTKAQTDAFAKMGLAASDLVGLSADEQFARIAEAIIAMEDPAARTAAAMDAFGKSGAALIPMMQGYRAAVAEAADHQERFGIALSDADAENLDALGDSMGRLKDSALGAANQFAVTFGPAMQVAIDAISASMIGLNAAMKDFLDFLETTQEETNLAAVALSMADVAENAEAAARLAERLADEFSRLNDGKTSDSLRAQAAWLRAQSDAFEAGSMSAEEYGVRVEMAIGLINDAIAQVKELNATEMSGAIGAMDGYLAAIGRALGGLINLKAAQDSIASGAASGPTGMESEAHGGRGAVPNWNPGLGTSPRPGRRDIDFGGSSGGGGGGGGGNFALEALVNELHTEREVLEEWYAEKQAIIQAASDAELAALGGKNEALERLQQEHQDRMSQIDAMARDGGEADAADYFGVLADTFARGNERLQKISRTFGAAEALINAYRAASQTLADPSLPFFAKFSAAAAVLGQGLAFVSAIKGGGGGGGSAGAGSGSGGAVAQPAGPQSVANIYFSGSSIASADLPGLFAQINEGLKQGRMINFVQVPA